MEIDIKEFKEWIDLFSDFAWPMVILFVVVIYRDVVAHFFIRVIDFVFRK